MKIKESKSRQLWSVDEGIPNRVKFWGTHSRVHVPNHVEIWSVYTLYTYILYIVFYVTFMKGVFYV